MLLKSMISWINPWRVEINPWYIDWLNQYIMDLFMIRWINSRRVEINPRLVEIYQWWVE